MSAEPQPWCEEAAEDLAARAESLGLKLGEDQIRLYAGYCRVLLEHNARANLTAMRTPTAVMRTLVLDSLTIGPALPSRLSARDASPRVIDVGSGSGAPGLPLKIAFPRWSLVLVESVAKKARFLEAAAGELELTDVTVLAERAERLGSEPAYRDAADLCLARAVAALPSLVELCAPLVRPGGLLAFPKSGDIESEIVSARAAARAVKVKLLAVEPVPEAVGLGSGRATVLYEKLEPTPSGYPRRVGLATSRPIGMPRPR